MSTLRLMVLASALVGATSVAVGEDSGLPFPRLGKPIAANEIRGWDKTIFPDGEGLPAGRGTAKEGRQLYAQKCASCHGRRGEGATAEELVGDPKPPSADDPSKSIGSYWPFATTIFDFISRSMPPAAPGSLSPDEVYALTAYLLAANKIIGETDEITERNLPAVTMPNRNGFIWIDAAHKLPASTR